MTQSFFQALSRRKTIEDDKDSVKLARVLTLVDLTALGVGSTLGLGVYVLAGNVAKFDAGPAVCLSFLVAAIASAFAGICYAEFASRVPKAGSAYIYSYVSVGEFIGYIIGWNLILEYVIGTASVARGLSGYIDALANNTMKNTMTELLPIDVEFLSPYPDFLSFLMVLLLAVLLGAGVKESTSFNNIFTALNLVTISIVIVAGAFKADPKNWSIPKEDIPKSAGNVGDGGFLPYGFAGVMAGAAKCFYGFVGFDCVATTGEEAKKPQRNIPLSIAISLTIVFFAYFAISTVLTMMWPYYDQDPDAPFPYVFEQVDWITIKWIVTVGAIFALCSSLLGAMFPLPRVLYAMANDGLIFRCMAVINPRTHTPLCATLVSGLLAGIMAAIFNLQQLVDMMSIGTLLAYTIVAICVLILRYGNDDNFKGNDFNENEVNTLASSVVHGVGKLFNLNMNKFPTVLTSTIANWCILLFSILAFVFCGLVIYAQDKIIAGSAYYITGLIVVVLLMIVVMICMSRQPTENAKLSFKVPLVPLLPCVSIIINAYLMLELDLHTWIRFIVWLIIGFLIYFFYGIHNSTEKQRRLAKELEKEKKQLEMTQVEDKDKNENRMYGKYNQIDKF